MNKPTPIAELLAHILGNNPRHEKKMRQYQLWSQWSVVVGEAIAAKAQPLRMQDTTLLIGVTSSAWVQELSMMKPRLLAKIHTVLDPALCTDLRFIVETSPA